MSKPKTKIEFVGANFDRTFHTARRVFVNGSEVRVAENGVKVDLAPNKATVVTLQILPAEVVFRGEDEAAESEESAK